MFHDYFYSNTYHNWLWVYINPLPYRFLGGEIWWVVSVLHHALVNAVAPLNQQAGWRLVFLEIDLVHKVCVYVCVSTPEASNYYMLAYIIWCGVIG